MEAIVSVNFISTLYSTSPIEFTSISRSLTILLISLSLSTLQWLQMFPMKKCKSIMIISLKMFSSNAKIVMVKLKKWMYATTWAIIWLATFISRWVTFFYKSRLLHVYPWNVHRSSDFNPKFFSPIFLPFVCVCVCANSSAVKKMPNVREKNWIIVGLVVARYTRNCRR